MEREEPIARNEVDHETPTKPDESASASSPRRSEETLNQSTQINQTGPRSVLHLQSQESHLSNSTTTHASSPSVNVTPKPDLSSFSNTTATQEPSPSAGLQIRTIEKDRSPGSAFPRHKRLPVFDEVCSGAVFPWYGPQEPDLPSSSGIGTMSANSHDDRRAYELAYPLPSRDIQSKKELRNAHLKTPTATLTNTTTTTIHGSRT
ncbi:Hypothetical protein [Arabidopsis thaliana]|uniref:F6F3.20 protein n=1 Tax=Arabidopsis thaliana TaxID=3702 RepID=Q9LNI3_ARATH|nr:uncharacterized protein AT1G01400 [Arabidopsis thaliana]AAF97343.1 Hypothetical protein [Arabidopsis thaliana]AAU44369.1 hypothetical protein AT1G01400 [Arabidopsis thaliana]AEE27282.1 hypothetical protein AT1G01400 [Arabidopsis thaliana]|eukprot:NP_171647.1 hypothetical protein AT1G01400 [Arabidopsis thaliana]